MWYEDCQIVGDQWTDNCGEPYEDPNNCYNEYVCTDDGDNGDPCTLYGIGCTPPPPPPGGETVNDDYQYTCPENFAFVSVTTNGLWQEAGISHSYCHLIYLTGGSGSNVNITLDIPVLYFGIPLKDQNGNVIFTSNQAKAMSADALNFAEYDMRNYFKEHPYASNNDLETYWIQRADARLKTTTFGQGKVTKTPSLNPTATVPIVPYIGCG